MKSVLFIVVPCYNEEEVIKHTASCLSEKLNNLVVSGKISENSRIVFVNDGSADLTWELICALHDENDVFSGISLAHNSGHQNAVLAGLMSIREKADVFITIDADLQDDVDAIDKMVDKYLDGCDIVYGVRDNRNSDTVTKRATAEGYYKLLKKLGCDIVFNHADFRLMSKRAVAALSEYNERGIYLRGIVPMLGFKTDVVTYARNKRFLGTTKYTPKKMLSLAADGITSLSYSPIRYITALGAIMLCLSFLLFLFSIITVFFGYTMLNWKIIVVAILATGGLILLSLGILGEYIARILTEVRGRPRYIIEDIRHKD